MGFRPKCPLLNNPLRGESARIEAVIIEQQSAKIHLPQDQGCCSRYCSHQFAGSSSAVKSIWCSIVKLNDSPTSVSGAKFSRSKSSTVSNLISEPAASLDIGVTVRVSG